MFRLKTSTPEVDPEELKRSPEEIAESILAEESEGRQAFNVLREMLGWFDWMARLGKDVVWFEVTLEDFNLLSSMPSFSLVYGGEGEHKVARYTFKTLQQDSFDEDIKEVMVIGDGKSTSMVAHSSEDPL